MPAKKSNNQDRAYLNSNFNIKIIFDPPEQKEGTNADNPDEEPVKKGKKAVIKGAGQLPKIVGYEYYQKILKKARGTRKQKEIIRIRHLKADVVLYSK